MKLGLSRRKVGDLCDLSRGVNDWLFFFRWLVIGFYFWKCTNLN